MTMYTLKNDAPTLDRVGVAPRLASSAVAFRADPAPVPARMGHPRLRLIAGLRIRQPHRCFLVPVLPNTRPGDLAKAQTRRGLGRNQRRTVLPWHGTPRL